MTTVSDGIVIDILNMNSATQMWDYILATYQLDSPEVDDHDHEQKPLEGVAGRHCFHMTLHLDWNGILFLHMRSPFHLHMRPWRHICHYRSVPQTLLPLLVCCVSKDPPAGGRLPRALGEQAEICTSAALNVLVEGTHRTEPARVPAQGWTVLLLKNALCGL